MVMNQSNIFLILRTCQIIFIYSPNSRLLLKIQNYSIIRLAERVITIELFRKTFIILLRYFLSTFFVLWFSHIFDKSPVSQNAIGNIIKLMQQDFLL